MDLTKPPDKILALSVAGVVVVLWVLVWLLGPKTESVPPDAGLDASLVTLLQGGKQVTEEQETVEEEVPGAWGRDPFALPYIAEDVQPESTPEAATPRPQPTQQGPQYKISTVLVSGSSRLAVIDDRVYTVGDQIGEERVAKITLDHVVLTGNFGERLLRVPKPQTQITVQGNGRK